VKKFAVAVLIIGTFILYSLLYGHANVVAVLPNNSTNSSSSGRGSSTNVVPATSGTTNTSGATGTSGTPGSLYKDGSYTGSVADAQWGYIQVKAIISNGKITDVQFLQYPNERNRSIMINNYADPQLTSEAIAAQSANVDIVTGATDTSQAFIQSLSDALSQAKA
jgi:uncharacterized protein with FMN-binding domain